jgi:DNA polymerase-1
MFELRADTTDGIAARATINSEIKRLCQGKFAYAVTITGRRIIVDANEAYAVVNYKIQSAARDIMAAALLRVMDDPELEPTVLLPIHDELLGQARKRQAERIAERYGEVMSTSVEGVPLTASGKVYGRSWGHGYRK